MPNTTNGGAPSIVVERAMHDYRQNVDSDAEEQFLSQECITASDRASDADRKWFAEHPNRSYRMRRALPFEFPEAEGDPVIIFQIHPGRRVKMPCNPGVPVINTEERCRYWFQRGVKDHNFEEEIERAGRLRQ